jgi:hypothetical protein
MLAKYLAGGGVAIVFWAQFVPSHNHVSFRLVVPLIKPPKSIKSLLASAIEVA